MSERRAPYHAMPEPSAPAEQPAGTYIAVVGINWEDLDDGSPRHAAPGEPVPATVIARSSWVLDQGLVRLADDDQVAALATSAAEGEPR